MGSPSCCCCTSPASARAPPSLGPALAEGSSGWNSNTPALVSLAVPARLLLLLVLRSLPEASKSPAMPLLGAKGQHRVIFEAVHLSRAFLHGHQPLDVRALGVGPPAQSNKQTVRCCHSQAQSFGKKQRLEHHQLQVRSSALSPHFVDIRRKSSPFLAKPHSWGVSP
eukprot:1159080-Pelagomonas_calceolata.AAC.1